MIGTSDQSCWLAEACKILLLLNSQSSLSATMQYLPSAVPIEFRWSQKVDFVIHGDPADPAHCHFRIFVV